MPEDKKHIITDLLLIKYIINDVGDREKKLVGDWLKQSIGNQDHFNKLSEIWSSDDYISLFDKIDIEKNWSEFKSRTNVKQNLRSNHFFHNIYFRLAAASVIIAFLFISVFYFIKDRYEKEIFANNIQELTLPDGSSITLNANSSITYTKDFNTNTRSVKLKGEAYFDVEKDTTRPFVVEVNQSSVHVLGTSFSIDATDISKVLVSVVHGKVRFFETDNQENFIDLEAGNQGIFDLKTRYLILKPSLRKNEYAWKTDTLVFSQTPLKEVFVDFKKFFKKEFLATDFDIEEYKLTSEFSNPKLADVLSELCVLYDLSCNISRDTVYFYKN